MNDSLKTILYGVGCVVLDAVILFVMAVILYSILSWALGTVHAEAPTSTDAKWVETGIIDDNGNTVYLNTRSLLKLPESGFIIARFKGFYTPWNQWIGIDFAVDCKKGIAGNFISADDLFKDGALTTPIRGTIGEGLMKLLCTGNPEGDL
jgi:hypothetical protein